MIALAIEVVVSGFIRRDRHYDRKDTLTNFALAVGNTLVGKAWGPLAFAAYLLGARVRLFDVPMQAAWAWALLFLGDDLCYYWSHRAAHRLPLLWASHQVHHTSRRFNLSVGARNSWTGGMLDWVFWMPLAVLGFPPVAIVAMQGMSLSWQFLVHAAYGGRLGPLGLVLNTPSHHRVHHGRNPQYLDRNFGGTLIVVGSAVRQLPRGARAGRLRHGRRAGAPLQSVVHRVFGLGGAPATIAEARATSCASTPPRKLNSRNDRATSSGAGRSVLLVAPRHAPHAVLERERERLALLETPAGDAGGDHRQPIEAEHEQIAPQRLLRQQARHRGQAKLPAAARQQGRRRLTGERGVGGVERAHLGPDRTSC